MKEWVCREFVHDAQHFFDEPFAEAIAAAVVPCGDLDNVVFYLRPWRPKSLLRSRSKMLLQCFQGQ